MRFLRIELLLALGLGLALSGCPREDPGPIKVGKAASRPAQPNKGAPPTTSANSGAGRKVYLTYCANCHGPDGTGSMMRKMMPKIGDLTSAAIQDKVSDSDIKMLVLNGRGKMPGFGGSINDDQMKALIAYVRTLKK